MLGCGMMATGWGWRKTWKLSHHCKLQISELKISRQKSDQRGLFPNFHTATWLGMKTDLHLPDVQTTLARAPDALRTYNCTRKTPPNNWSRPYVSSCLSKRQNSTKENKKGLRSLIRTATIKAQT